MTTWTKCSDSLPDDEITVLIATDDGYVLTAYHENGSWWETTNVGDVSVPVVTHWAHLPPHPEDTTCA